MSAIPTFAFMRLIISSFLGIRHLILIRAMRHIHRLIDTGRQIWLTVHFTERMSGG